MGHSAPPCGALISPGDGGWGLSARQAGWVGPQSRSRGQGMLGGRRGTRWAFGKVWL